MHISSKRDMMHYKPKDTWNAYVGIFNRHENDSKAIVTAATTTNSIVDVISGIDTGVSLISRALFGVTNYFLSVPLGMELKEKSMAKYGVDSAKKENLHDGLLGMAINAPIRMGGYIVSYYFLGRETDWESAGIATGVSTILTAIATPLLTFIADCYKELKGQNQYMRTPEFIRNLDDDAKTKAIKASFAIAAGITSITYTIGTYFNGF